MSFLVTEPISHRIVKIVTLDKNVANYYVSGCGHIDSADSTFCPHRKRFVKKKRSQHIHMHIPMITNIKKGLFITWTNIKDSC